jgi:hypothetical protein
MDFKDRKNFSQTLDIPRKAAFFWFVGLGSTKLAGQTYVLPPGRIRGFLFG